MAAADTAQGELQRHRWNTDFRWDDHAGPFGFVSAEQAKRFDENGFVVIDDVFPDDRLAEVREEIDRFEAKTEEFLQKQKEQRMAIAESGAITFTTHLVTRSQVVREFSADPVFAAICSDLVGPDVNLYWDQAVYKKPEKPRRFPWHQDNGYTYVEPQQYLTCWVPLVDATIDNGCPQVATGLHRMGTLKHRYVDPLGFECFSEPPAGSTAAEARAGSIVVFSSLTPHLTGPNTSGEVRKAYILQYAPDGAVALEGDPRNGEPTRAKPCDDPDRQYPVVRAGVRLDPPPLPTR